MHYLTLALAILSALTVLAGGIASLLKKQGDDAHTAELDAAHEALHILVQILDEHEHGADVLTSVVAAVKSPEAQDLLHKVLAKVRS